MNLGTPILRRAAWRHLLRHPWQTGLTVLGIALSVAVVVGIDLANTSAERAFVRSVEDVAGRATHEIVGGPRGLDDAVYAELRRSGIAVARTALPIVEGRARIAGRNVRWLGLELFAGVGNLGPLTGATLDGAETTALLVEPGAVMLGRQLAERLGVTVGGRLTAEVAGPVSGDLATVELQVVTLIDSDDERARRALDDLLISDIATAQESFGRLGHIDRIDLQLPDGDLQAIAELEAILPAGATLQAKSARSGALAEMTRAFRLNLEALALLALLVGTFLVYNTLTFSVVQRRPLIGRLRALGVTRREIFALVLLEAATLGALGTGLGLIAGVGLAQGLVDLVMRTINDLYFALDVAGAEIAPSSLIKGVALGVGGPLLASIVPAREATTAPPRLTLQRSEIESRAHRAVPKAALIGLVLAIVATALLGWPSRDLWPAFAGVFAVVLAFACLVPAAIVIASRALVPITARLFGGLGRLAARGLEATLSRTGVAAAALVIAIATTLGIAIMVSSFRATLIDWLEVTLQADVYVTSADQTGRGAPALDPTTIEAVLAAPGVRSATTYRRVEVPVESIGDSQLHVMQVVCEAFDIFRFAEATDNDRDRIFERFAAGDGVLVSEPYAYRHGLRAGDSLRLRSPRGPIDREILAVFYDYASDRGLILAHRQLYDRYWDDPAIHSLSLILDAGLDTDAAVEQLRTTVPGADALSVIANRELKRTSLAIFDRTFRITGVLRVLAVAVAFLGILSALMALQLERARELGVLRASGMVPGQVWALVTAQTGLLGLLCGLLAVPLGTLLASLLIHVINKRSFGWTLQMEVPPEALAQTVLLAIVAALLAGLWPAHRMARSSPALALREE